MPHPSSVYSPISQDSDPNGSSEKFLDRSVGDGGSPIQGSQPTWRRLFPWGLAATFFVLFLLVAFMALRTPTDAECVAKLSTFSPLFDFIEYESVVFNGTLTHSSKYRGPPSPEVDAAWEEVSTGLHPVRASEEVLVKAGVPITPSLVRFHEEDGGGYMAAVEFTHQLHCLNSLRKFTYLDYYKQNDEFFQAQPDTIRHHIDHCIEILRQNLMCTSDVGLLTYQWVDGYSHPYPDFNTRHQCRRFDKLLHWAYDNEVAIPASHVTRFADTVDLAEEP